MVVEVRTRTAFAEFEGRLRARDFSGDQESGVICRWRHRQGLILDAMPSDPSILGFANQWQGEGLAYAVERELPSGAIIRALTPPYLLATKLEAFKGRGHRDYVASPDFDDIIALVDGREEVVNEVATRAPMSATTSRQKSRRCFAIPDSTTAFSRFFDPTQAARPARRG